MVYDTTLLDNSTNIINIFTNLGTTASGDQFIGGYLILLVFFLVVSMTVSYSTRLDFLEATIPTSFLTTILAFLLTYAGLVESVAIVYSTIYFVGLIVVYFIIK